MKKLFLIVFTAFLALSAGKVDTPGYIKEYSSLAISEMNRSGIPASISMAQAILESASGTSDLAVKANNHFGIKCGSSWDGPTTSHDDDRKGECFRVYSSADQSWINHSDFLSSSPRYSQLFRLERTDYRSWARGLSECGYATDRKYATKLIDLIEEYRLYQLDGGLCPAGQSAAEDVLIEEPLHGGVEKFDENISIVMEREVACADGRSYIIAADGDTYRSIARQYGLFTSEILRFNGVDKSAVLQPGTRVYISKDIHRK